MPERIGVWAILCALILPGAEQADGTPFRPNIILITVDTFRPDHLGYYGYPKDTSPNLDAISGEGIFFREAFTTSAWTAPGLISTLTSLYAPTHGVDIRGRRLDPEVVTLPEVLVAAGYRAPDICFLTSIPNFSNLGLQPYARRRMLIHQGDEIFFRWLEEDGKREAPFFLYYHYRDLHLPYDPGEPYESMFLPEAFVSAFAPVGALRRFIAAEKMEVVKTHVMITRGVMDFSARDSSWVRALYDAQIRRLDEEFFGRLRRTLQREKLDRNTLVIISADHGEELLDRDLIGHVSTFKEGRLFDELVRIPLIFWFPDVLPAGSVVEEPVQCIDVMPTILDLLDLPLPGGAQGQSLLPLLEGRAGWRRRPLFFETSAAGYTADEEQYRQRFRAVRTTRWKWISSSPGEESALYDLAVDPGEREDVAQAHPRVADSLRTLLNEWILFSQRRPFKRDEGVTDTAAVQVSGSALEEIDILFPADSDTLRYQGTERGIHLRWTGPPQAAYAIEYEVGKGAYHLEGVINESGNAPSYGPFQPNVWNSLVLYNPWKFRVYLSDSPQNKSEWVTFYLAPVDGWEDGGISWMGVALQGWQVLRGGVTHAGNLVRGLGRGVLDLYLLIDSISAAALSAYALLLIIVGAIAWPHVQWLGRERFREWGIALLYIAFVYSTIPVMPRVWRALERYTEGSIRYLGVLAVVLGGAAIGVRVWRRIGRRRWQPYAILLGIGMIYIYLLHRYAVFPAERLHLVEYGFMGWLLFRALSLDLSERNAYIASFLGTVLVGTGDEFIQWILPQRFFELKDVQLNAVSGGLGLLLLRFVMRSSETESGNRGKDPSKAIND